MGQGANFARSGWVQASSSNPANLLVYLKDLLQVTQLPAAAGAAAAPAAHSAYHHGWLLASAGCIGHLTVAACLPACKYRTIHCRAIHLLIGRMWYAVTPPNILS
jgi:hypothetical protein